MTWKKNEPHNIFVAQPKFLPKKGGLNNYPYPIITVRSYNAIFYPTCSRLSKDIGVRRT